MKSELTQRNIVMTEFFHFAISKLCSAKMATTQLEEEQRCSSQKKGSKNDSLGIAKTELVAL